jgi:capsular exopolysaccharide synthesis family protein
MLNRGKGEIADAIRPLVDAPVVPPPPQVSTEVASGAPPKAEVQAVLEAMPDAMPEKVTPVPAASLAAIRTMGLHLPAPSPLLPFEEGQWRPSEQYRILRTKIGQHPKQPHLIVVSSPAPGDGKSVSAINIAGALSLKSEGQVLLVDGDFRKSAVHVQLGLPESPGLVDVLKGTCTLEEALVHVQEFPNLFVMSAGTPPDNPVELLDSAPWKELTVRLRGLFRYVVLDSPPVGAVADYDLIQAACDGVILVVRPDHTHRQLCRKALENVPKAKFLGVLLNCVPDWSPAKHSGADYYYYSSEKAYPNTRKAAAG